MFPNSRLMIAMQFEGHHFSVDGVWMRSGGVGGDPNVGTTSSAIRLDGEDPSPYSANCNHRALALSQLLRDARTTYSSDTAKPSTSALDRSQIPAATREWKQGRQLCWHVRLLFWFLTVCIL